MKILFSIVALSGLAALSACKKEEKAAEPAPMENPAPAPADQNAPAAPAPAPETAPSH